MYEYENKLLILKIKASNITTLQVHIKNQHKRKESILYYYQHLNNLIFFHFFMFVLA
jgi:hypothetical protein